MRNTALRNRTVNVKKTESTNTKKPERTDINKGLTNEDAVKRLTEHGQNTFAEKKPDSAVTILLRQFSDYMVLILIAATIISAFMGEVTEAITIIAIIILNAILGFVQEYKTEKTMEALKGLSAPVARVIRDGRKQTIPAKYVVPGDVILLEAGDRVPADAIINEANNLQVDESPLTGESVPVEKEKWQPGKPYLKE